MTTDPPLLPQQSKRLFYRSYFKALRPHHGIKNLVIFAAPWFALRFDTETFVASLLAFFVFYFVSSGFYLLNDVIDLPADKLHPVKRNRPIASGLIPIPVAVISAFILIVPAIVASFLKSPALGGIIVLYGLLQIAYNARLKHVAILDMMCISAGFVLRALAGAVATHTPPSSWFILCIGLLAFYLAIEKRKAELNALGEQTKTRAVLLQYSVPWLLRMESTISASILISYALWSIDASPTPWLLATTPFVMYGLFKYQYLSERGEGEAPEMTLIKHSSLWLNLVLWIITTLLIMMVQHHAIPQIQSTL